LCSPGAWNELIDNILPKFHRIDVLVNCIGSIVPGTLETLQEGDIQNMIQSNFVNTVNGVKAVIPVMRQQGYGHIVNVGSLGGIVPMPFESVYSATKFAMRGLSLSLTDELKDVGLFVSLISCGPVRTKMLDLEAQDERSTTAFIIKPIEPIEVAKAILSVINHPQREVILPKMTGRLAILFGLFPNLSGALFPFIDILGRKRQKIYRRSMNPEIPAGMEN
jgi:3-oxoacyl-[acyl-carrier protein] reductase